jgi:hypothetical protein
MSTCTSRLIVYFSLSTIDVSRDYANLIGVHLICSLGPIVFVFQLEPCADAIMSAAARRVFLVGGGGAPSG